MYVENLRFKHWLIPFILFVSIIACQLPGFGSSDSETAPPAAPAESAAPAVASDEGDSAPAAEQPPDTAAESESNAAEVTEDSEGSEPPAPPPTEAIEPAPQAEDGAESASSPATENVEEVAAVPENVNTAFILDASGSMQAELNGRPRLAIAQDAIGALSAGLPPEMNASLWLYGHRLEQEDKAASCQDIEEVIGLGPVDAARFNTVAHSFGAKGYTPITEALRQAATSLPIGPNERNSIVLVSDGEETCEGDPCALAAELAAGDVQLVVHTIGFAVDEVTRAQLQCIADVTGGTYRDANDADGLELALEEAADTAIEQVGGLVEGLGRPSSIAVSPDGRHVYVTSGVSDGLVVFSRNPDTGILAFVELHIDNVDGIDGLDKPQWVTVSPDNKNVYVASLEDGAVSVFSRDPGTGRLTFVEMEDVSAGVAGVDGTRAVAVSPDNKHVYVTGTDNASQVDAVAVFSRDTNTGSLALTEAHHNGTNGVEGLDNITAVAVSPDNNSVYVTSDQGSGAVIFNRNPDSGGLSFVEAVPNEASGLGRLAGAQVLMVSPDSKNVYVTSRRGDIVVVFSRNPDTGALTHMETLKRTATDLDGAHAVTVSPDGQHVYVTADNTDRLLTFARDSGTGALTHVTTLNDNTDGVDGLENAVSAAFSPDGRYIYVAGLDDDSVSVFNRDSATGILTFVEVVRNTDN